MYAHEKKCPSICVAWCACRAWLLSQFCGGMRKMYFKLRLNHQRFVRFDEFCVSINCVSFAVAVVFFSCSMLMRIYRFRPLSTEKFPFLSNIFFGFVEWFRWFYCSQPSSVCPIRRLHAICCSTMHGMRWLHLWSKSRQMKSTNFSSPWHKSSESFNKAQSKLWKPQKDRQRQRQIPEEKKNKPVSYIYYPLFYLFKYTFIVLFVDKTFDSSFFPTISE